MPIIAVLVGLLAILMFVPMLVAVSDSDWRSARGFLYPAVFGLFIAAAISTLQKPMSGREPASREILILVLVWLALPVVAAVPLVLLTPAIGSSGAWFEMVAALTTTGGTVYVDP
ncbi:MAG: hypothetical protein AAGB15_02240, partial [Pseudomonadota bacterium]